MSNEVRAVLQTLADRYILGLRTKGSGAGYFEDLTAVAAEHGLTAYVNQDTLAVTFRRQAKRPRPAGANGLAKSA